jgi:hypothetical protein
MPPEGSTTSWVNSRTHKLTEVSLLATFRHNDVRQDRTEVRAPPRISLAALDPEELRT